MIVSLLTLTPNPSPRGRGELKTLSLWERVPKAGEGKPLIYSCNSQ